MPRRSWKKNKKDKEMLREYETKLPTSRNQVIINLILIHFLLLWRTYLVLFSLRFQSFVEISPREETYEKIREGEEEVFGSGRRKQEIQVTSQLFLG